MEERQEPYLRRDQKIKAIIETRDPVVWRAVSKHHQAIMRATLCEELILTSGEVLPEKCRTHIRDARLVICPTP